MCSAPCTPHVAEMTCKGPGNTSNEFPRGNWACPGLPECRQACAAFSGKIWRIRPGAVHRGVIFSRIAAISGFARVHCAERMPAPPRKTRAGLAIGVGTHGADGPGRWPIARDSQKLIQGATPTLCKGKKVGFEPRIQVRFPRRLTKMATDASRCPSVCLLT